MTVILSISVQVLVLGMAMVDCSWPPEVKGSTQIIEAHMSRCRLGLVRDKGRVQTAENGAWVELSDLNSQTRTDPVTVSGMWVCEGEWVVQENQ